jgi:hypothetical protein
MLRERLVDVEELARQGLREAVLESGLGPGTCSKGDVVGLVRVVDGLARRRVRAVLLDTAQRELLGEDRPRLEGLVEGVRGSVLSEIQSSDGSSGFSTELRCSWKLDSCK